MLVLLAILVLIAAIAAPWLLTFRRRRPADFGSMSERWIAEYRASHP
jgi:hypothetical protein